MATSEHDDAFDPAHAPAGGVRAKLRAKPGVREVYRVGVFVLGLAFIGAGIALAALPSPLTIPPVLLGLWIWSSEFRFAERLFDSFKEKGKEAWDQAKARPALSAFVTVG